MLAENAVAALAAVVERETVLGQRKKPEKEQK